MAIKNEHIQQQKRDAISHLLKLVTFITIYCTGIGLSGRIINCYISETIYQYITSKGTA